MTTLNELRDRAYQHAADKGFWEGTPNVGEKLALIHSEISEALEEHRAGHRMAETYYAGDKPEGVPSELADAIIRILDLCGACDIDIEAAVMGKMEYNSSRPPKHDKRY